MAGKLVQVATETADNSSTSVTLTGIDSDNVYMLAITNMTVSADTTMKMRVTASGTPDTTSNYDRALKQLRADSAFNNINTTNADNYTMGSISTIALQESFQGIFYLYNFYNSSEYSFVTVEDTLRQTAGHLRGNNGGFVHTVNQSCNGVQILTGNTNTISGGVFTLYKVV